MSIKIYGHRGARGLSPENTLPGYQTALNIGVDAIDMDVGMTKDGEIVVTHDYSLNPDITRHLNGQWLKEDANLFIKDLTLAELQNYDVGRIKSNISYANLFSSQYPVDHTTIPTLKQVIKLAKKNIKDQIIFQIEIKTNPEAPRYTFSPKEFAEGVAKIILEEDIVERTQVQAFDYRCLLELQKIHPEIHTAFLTSELDKIRPAAVTNLWRAGHRVIDHNDSVPKMIATLGGKIWGPEDVELTPELVREAHELGLKVIPWNWPEREKTEFNLPLAIKLIDMGVDGIITDRPDILRGLLAARGKLNTYGN